MPYTMWTQKGLEIYSNYLKNIEWQQVGYINISGIYDKHDFFTEHKVAAYAYRIYDKNVFCPERACVTGAGTGVLGIGTVTGLVIALAKENETGNFLFDSGKVDPQKVTIAHPGAIWIASHYTGECKIIGQQVVRDHQGIFHEQYCTHHSDGSVDVALSTEHILKFLLPDIAEAYAMEIAAMDSDYVAKTQ